MMVGIVENLVTAAVGSFVVLVLCGAAAPTPIKIGAYLDITGPAAYLGDPEAKTLKLYAERINRGGGRLGRYRERALAGATPAQFLLNAFSPSLPA